MDVLREMDDFLEDPNRDTASSTASTPRKRPLKRGKQARAKCDNCRASHLRCSPERDSPTDSGCDTCKRQDRTCGGYTVKVRQEKRPKQSGARPGTPEQSHLVSPPQTSSPSSRAISHRTRGEDLSIGVRNSEQDRETGEELDQLFDTPIRNTSRTPDQHTWEYQDLMDATNIFLTLKIEVNILQRQRRRLIDLFCFVDESPPQTSLLQVIEDLRTALEKAIRARLRNTTPNGSGENLLRLVSRFLQHPESSLVDTVRIDMMRAEVLGNEFIKCARSISESPRGLSQERLEHLAALGNALIQRIPRIEKIFGVQIPAILKSKELSLPAHLICASWGCDLDSEAFVNCSFLWNWIRADILRLLKSQVRIEWVQDPSTVVDHGINFALIRDVEESDIFGHCFVHVAVLAGTGMEKHTVFIDDSRDLFTWSVRDSLHYAAAMGNESICRALADSRMAPFDKDRRLPSFYAVKNGHLGLAKLLAAMEEEYRS